MSWGMVAGAAISVVGNQLTKPDSSGGGSGGGGTLTPAEVAELERQQAVLSNPNYFNVGGSSQTTFDPITGQPTVRQELSPELMGLYDQMISQQQGGPQQYTPPQGGYNRDMRNQFSNSFSNRMGAPPRTQAMGKIPSDGFNPQMTTPIDVPPSTDPFTSIQTGTTPANMIMGGGSGGGGRSYGTGWGGGTNGIQGMGVNNGGGGGGGTLGRRNGGFQNQLAQALLNRGMI